MSVIEKWQSSRINVAPSLSSLDGLGLCKTNQAALLHHIESLCSPRSVVGLDKLSDTAIIVDAMALIQSLPAGKLQLGAGLHILAISTFNAHLQRCMFIVDC